MIDEDGGDHGRVCLYQIRNEINIHELATLFLLFNLAVLDHELQHLTNLLRSFLVEETEAKWINVHPDVDDLAISLLLLDLAQPVHRNADYLTFSLLVLFIGLRHWPISILLDRLAVRDEMIVLTIFVCDLREGGVTLMSLSLGWIERYPVRISVHVCYRNRKMRHLVPVSRQDYENLPMIRGPAIWVELRLLLLCLTREP